MVKGRLIGRTLVAVLAACSCGAPLGTHAQARELVDLSLEQLANVVVTSVAGRAQPLAEAAASVYVVTGEDIRRSAATSLPEALRLAPNLDVARVNANQYVVSARGFASTTGNKMLVLIDGRTVYTPLFSGTFWEAQDVLLEDIDRIEVISGPGATLWGANAVNGVINVVTRRADATQGGLLSAQAGTTQRDAAARYGGNVAGGHYRVYAKTVRRDETFLASGASALESGKHNQGGFRVDWGQRQDGFTFQGDTYEGDTGQQGREFTGLNLLGRWTRPVHESGELKVQAYFDRTWRRHVGVFEETLETYDLELQHAPGRNDRHQFLWGLGLRRHYDEVINSATIIFEPPSRSLSREHVFVQDEVALRPDVALTLGAKLESNSYTGIEFLPSARIGWRSSPESLVWAAVSRTVRSPSRIDRELVAPANVPPIVGSADFQSEVAKVLELGYRAQPGPRLSYSLTAAFSDYERIRSVSPAPGGSVVANDQEAKSKALEGWASWRASERLRLNGGFVLQDVDIRPRPGTVNLSAPGTEGNDPDYWVKLGGSFDLTSAHELDLHIRRIGSRPDPAVPAYTALDARLGWRATRNMELSVVGQNLLDPGHPEWGPQASRSEIDRALFVRLRVGL